MVVDHYNFSGVLRTSIPVWFLLILLLVIPKQSHSQTRFFQRGDSGLIASYSFSEEKYLDGDGTGARVSYTHKGWFDVGFGYANINGYDFSKAPKGVFGNVVFIQPHDADGFGLEAQGRFAEKSRSYYNYYPNNIFDPQLTDIRYRTYQAGLRGFYRNSFGPKSGMVLGLRGLYQFRQYQVRDEFDVVTSDRDAGELGIVIDLHFLFWGIAHFSLSGGASQENLFRYKSVEPWVSLRVGVLIGLNTD